jgi:hypothetical protein
MFQKLKMTYLATAHVDPKMLALLKGYLFWIPQSMQIQNNVDRKFYVFLNMQYACSGVSKIRAGSLLPFLSRL